MSSDRNSHHPEKKQQQHPLLHSIHETVVGPDGKNWDVTINTAGVKHTVQPGETMYSIARAAIADKTHKPITQQELSDFLAWTAQHNHLTTAEARNSVHPGQILVIPELFVDRTQPNQKAQQLQQAVVSKAALSERRLPAGTNEVAAATPVAAVAPSQAANAPEATSNRTPSQKNPTGRESWSEIRFATKLIAQNETGQKGCSALNRDDNHKGPSGGLFQWHQNGKLPKLFQAWNDKYPGKFASTFKPNAESLLDPKYVQAAKLSTDDRFIGQFSTALHDKSFCSVQYEIADQQVRKSFELARANKFFDPVDKAILADVVNQMGDGGAGRVLAAIPKKGPEPVRMAMLEDLTKIRAHGDERANNIKRGYAKAHK